MKTPEKQKITPTLFIKIRGKDNVTSIALKNTDIKKTKEVGNSIVAMYKELGIKVELTYIENENGIKL